MNVPADHFWSERFAAARGTNAAGICCCAGGQSAASLKDRAAARVACCYFKALIGVRLFAQHFCGIRSHPQLLRNKNNIQKKVVFLRSRKVIISSKGQLEAFTQPAVTFFKGLTSRQTAASKQHH